MWLSVCAGKTPFSLVANGFSAGSAMILAVLGLALLAACPAGCAADTEDGGECDSAAAASNEADGTCPGGEVGGEGAEAPCDCLPIDRGDRAPQCLLRASSCHVYDSSFA